MRGFTILVDIYVFSEWIDDTPEKVSLTFDKVLVERILKLSRAVKSLEVDSITLYDYTPEFLDENGEQVHFASDCNTLHIRDEDIYWGGYVKHTEPSVGWETDVIPISTLREVSRVWRTSKSRLPLLMGTLKTEQAQEILNERLKKL